MFDAVVRDKGNAKTDARQVDQKIIGIQLKSRYQIQTMFQKDLVEIFLSSIRIGRPEISLKVISLVTCGKCVGLAMNTS